MEKKIYTLLFGSVFCGLLSAATITTGGFDESVFDGFRGVVITSSTSSENASFPTDRLFDGDSSGGDLDAAVIFTSLGEGGGVFVNFNTASAVEILELKLALREDAGGGMRSASAWVLYGNDTGVDFTSEDTISSGEIDADYLATYGSNAIVVTESDLSVTAQYFRLELTQGDASGIRALELGALVTVPEVAQSGLLLGGVLLGFALFRRRR